MLPDDQLVYFGASVKALGSGKIGGLVAPFRTAANPDSHGDYFTPRTDFGLDVNDRARVVYHHGATKAFGKAKLAIACLALGSDGLHGEGKLDLSRADHRAIYAKAEKGELYWSSATSPHLMERRGDADAGEIVSWPIIEVSLTPTPADRMARAVAMKAIIDSALKGEHLGDVEHGMARAALSSLHYAMTDRIESHMRDAKKSKADKLAACKGCLDEHHEAAMKTLRAILPEDAASASMKAREERLAAIKLPA